MGKVTKGARKEPFKEWLIKSIKRKLLFIILSIMIGVGMIVILFSASLSYKGAQESLEKTLTELVKVTANQVASQLGEYGTLAEGIGSSAILNLPIIDTKNQEGQSQENQVRRNEVITELERIKQQYNFKTIEIFDTKGVALSTQVDMSKEDYVAKVLETGEVYISDIEPLQSTGTLILRVSAPLIRERQQNGVISIGIDAMVVSDIIETIQVGESGSSEILDASGTTIGNNDRDMVLNRINYLEMDRQDDAVKDVIAITEKRITGEPDVSTYSFNGVKRVAAYAPIPGTNGWTIDVAVNQSEFISYTLTAIGVTLIVGTLLVVLAGFAIFKYVERIVRPIKQVTDVAQNIADGDYDVTLQVTCVDEARILADSIQTMMDSTKGVILDVSNVLEQMAQGNLDVGVNTQYGGVFTRMEESLAVIIDGLNKMVGHIAQASHHVSEGALQVANDAANLVEVTNEQVAAIDEFKLTIDAITTTIDRSVEQTNHTTVVASDAKVKVDEGVDKMNKLLDSMDHINEASHNVSQVIKVIDGIAAQTNLLALNAAIEAARAGDSGRGFAVVATEIRELANKSAHAVKEIEQIVVASIKSVEEGKVLADEASSSLLNSVTTVEETVKVAAIIRENSEEQRDAVKHLVTGIEEISEMITMVSNSSQESAAVSEELLSQAESLRDLTDRFKTKG